MALPDLPQVLWSVFVRIGLAGIARMYRYRRMGVRSRLAHYSDHRHMRLRGRNQAFYRRMHDFTVKKPCKEIVEFASFPNSDVSRYSLRCSLEVRYPPKEASASRQIAVEPCDALRGQSGLFRAIAISRYDFRRKRKYRRTMKMEYSLIQAYGESRRREGGRRLRLREYELLVPVIEPTEDLSVSLRFDKDPPTRPPYVVEYRLGKALETPAPILVTVPIASKRRGNYLFKLGTQRKAVVFGIRWAFEEAAPAPAGKPHSAESPSVPVEDPDRVHQIRGARSNRTPPSREGVSRAIREAENQQLEFKETLHVDTRTGQRSEPVLHGALKTIAGFLNTDGGTLYIGVTDDNRDIMGLSRDYAACSPQNADGFEQKLRAALGSRLRPIVLGKVRATFMNIDDKDIAVVEVDSSPVIVYMDDNDLFVRDGNRTLKLAAREAVEWASARGQIHGSSGRHPGGRPSRE